MTGSVAAYAAAEVMALLDQIRSAHGCDEPRALALLRRQLQPTWIRLAFAVAPGLFAEHRSQWEQLLADLGRCRNSGEIIGACRYWRERRPMSLAGWPHAWCLRVETRRAVLAGDRYLAESTAGEPG